LFEFIVSCITIGGGCFFIRQPGKEECAGIGGGRDGFDDPPPLVELWRASLVIVATMASALVAGEVAE